MSLNYLCSVNNVLCGQRYWWHLYIERLDSFEGREVNPPEANYLPELRPAAWERKDLHPLPISFFWDSCYIKLYPTPIPHVHSCWPGILTAVLICLHPGAGPLYSGDAWRTMQKDTDSFCGAVSFIRNEENVQVCLYLQYFPQYCFLGNVDFSLC